MPEKPNNGSRIMKIYLWVIVLVIILGGGGFFLYTKVIAPNMGKIGGFSLVQKSSEQKINDLDGTKVDADKADRNPLAIVVENHPDARPQAGLDKASVIYEAIAEGGITRFMAVYGPRDADKIGPVRSARTYFIDILSEYKAFFGHCGGNLDALDQIKSDNILDLDQFALDTTGYWRDYSTGVDLEHTLFTSTKLLYGAAEDRNWNMNASFRPWKFKKESKKSEATTQNITIDFSTSSYRVDWQYDQEENKYLRTMAGIVHRDRSTGEQLSASNVIVQSVERWLAVTAINEEGWGMKIIGTGKAKVFSEGQEIDATWKKTDRNSRTVFTDSEGKEIEFLPGQTWVEIVPPEVFGKI